MSHCHCSTRVEALSLDLGGKPVLRDVSFSLDCGELLAVIGPNGAGKSSLLKAMLGEYRYRGKVSFSSPSGEETKPRIGYVPQSIALDADSPVSVMDFLVSGLSRRPAWLGASRVARRAAMEALERVQAGKLADRTLGELSGGEAQRVFLALAMSPLPNLLLLDEPLSAVDASGIRLFYETLCELRKDYDLSLVVVSHDIAGIAPHADRVLALDRAPLALGSPAEVLARPEVVARLGGVPFDLSGLAPGHLRAEEKEHHGSVELGA